MGEQVEQSGRSCADPRELGMGQPPCKTGGQLLLRLDVLLPFDVAEEGLCPPADLSMRIQSSVTYHGQGVGTAQMFTARPAESKHGPVTLEYYSVVNRGGGPAYTLCGGALKPSPLGKGDTEEQDTA